MIWTRDREWVTPVLYVIIYWRYKRLIFTLVGSHVFIIMYVPVILMKVYHVTHGQLNCCNVAHSHLQLINSKFPLDDLVKFYELSNQFDRFYLEKYHFCCLLRNCIPLCSYFDCTSNNEQSDYNQCMYLCARWQWRRGVTCPVLSALGSRPRSSARVSVTLC